MGNNNFRGGQLADISPPAGIFAIAPSEDPLPFRCRELYNGSNAVIGVTAKTVANQEELPFQLGPYQHLEGRFTHVTGVSDEGVLFGMS